MRLASGTFFMGRPAYGSVLYMREDYTGMLEELLKLFASGTRKVVVSGNPGIGKSWFGFVVLHHLATRELDTRVVWESRRKQCRYLFDGASVQQGDLAAFASVLEDATAWYIVDELEKGGPGPNDSEAKAIVLSSPKRENYNSILKAIGATIRYMPVWSWEEIETCHALLYADDPERPLKEVEQAYTRWGGIPRYVLEKLRDPSIQNELGRSVSRSDMAKLTAAVGELEAADDLSHRVLHIAVTRPYINTTVVFGSSTIANLVLTKLESQDSDRLVSFLRYAVSDPTIAGFRGMVFEAYAHRALRAGGTFQVRRLTAADGDETSTIELKLDSELRLLKTVNDLGACPAGAYCQALAQNFPVVDAAVLPSQLFQMTVSPKHGVSRAGLRRVLGLLPAAPRYDLFFVVPDELFDRLGIQRYDGGLGANRSAEQKQGMELDDRMQRVVQWVLCIPFDARSDKGNA